GMLYLNNFSVICLQLPTALLIFYYAYRGVTSYKASGFTLWLLLANGVPIFVYSIGTLFV
ncbi:MAG: hypothetical protein ACKO96_43290, partial [Flammeovirgaceae bacterium]